MELRSWPLPRSQPSTAGSTAPHHPNPVQRPCQRAARLVGRFVAVRRDGTGGMAAGGLRLQALAHALRAGRPHERRGHPRGEVDHGLHLPLVRQEVPDDGAAGGGGILSAEVKAKLAAGYAAGAETAAASPSKPRHRARRRSSTRGKTRSSAQGAAGGWSGRAAATRAATAARTRAAARANSRSVLPRHAPTPWCPESTWPIRSRRAAVASPLRHPLFDQ
jgi:hypothetical protein